jgi:hypothetical protein
MIAILTTHNGNTYKSKELVAVTEKEGYYLLITKYGDNDIPVAEMVINRNEVKTLRTINGKPNEPTRNIQGPVREPHGHGKKIRPNLRG